MTSPTCPTSPQPPAAVLTTVATLAALPPPTLTSAMDTFSTIKHLGAALQGTEFAEVGKKIVAAAESASFGEDRVRTLPQAREKLAAIGALIPAAPQSASTPTPSAPPIAERRAEIRAKMHARSAAAATAKPETVPPAATTDAAIYERYGQLTGHARHEYLSAHRAELVREHARLAHALTPAESDVLERYGALSGAARQEFYRQNENAIWSAFRRQRRAR